MIKHFPGCFHGQLFGKYQVREKNTAIFPMTKNKNVHIFFITKPFNKQSCRVNSCVVTILKYFQNFEFIVLFTFFFGFQFIRGPLGVIRQ